MSIRRKGDLVVLQGARAIVQIGGGGGGHSQTPPADTADTRAKHTASVVKVQVSGAVRELTYAPWGSANNRPDLLLAEADKSGILKAALTVRRKVHFGTGPMYFTMQSDGENERELPIRETDPRLADIMAFHRANRMEAYLREMVLNHEWWGWTITEFVVSNDCTKILSMRPLKTMWGRWTLMNAEGRIEWLVFNPNWALYNTEFVRAVPVADPWWTPEEVKAWLKDTGFRKFVRPTMVPDPDAGYYPDLDWFALYDSLWLQGNNRIPIRRDAAMKNAASIKYHIKIPANYFEQKFKDIWATLSPEQKLEKENDVLEAWDGFFTGPENEQKVMITRFLANEMGEPLAGSGWTVEPIQDFSKDGKYIPDAEKGNSEILAVTGVDPTLLGQGAPGGKLGAGSGSDKFEAIRILHALLYMDQDMTLEPWHFCRDYNGWSKDIYLGYRPLDLSLPEPEKAGAAKPTNKPPDDAN